MMRKVTGLALVALLTISTTAFAQRGQDRPRDGDRPAREGDRPRGPRDGERPEGRGFDRFVPPVMAALDTNKDGELSAEEVAGATKSLKALDKNEDGVIDREELRPEPPEGGRGRGPRGPGDAPREGDRPRPEGDRPPRDGDRPPREGDRGPEGRGPQGRGPGGPDGGPAGFVDRMMQADTDGDGKLSREELQKAAENFGRGRGGRGGREEGSDRPNRPE